MRYVFVYGTLRRGEVNDINHLSPTPEFIGTSSIGGTLYPLGWYPGLVLDGRNRVVGEVYAVSTQLEIKLDEIEGLLPEPSGEYFKREVAVEVDDRTITCFVYEIAPALVSGLLPMPSSDWLLRSTD